MTSTPSPRVLVVDDEIGFRELCTDLLGDNGYETDAAANGREALQYLEKEKYQLVLSDINMPVMDGLEFLKSSKSKYPSIEIILMTAYGGLQSALEALRFGAYDYITKPFTRDGLLATVRRCVEKQRLSHELKIAQDELIKKEKLAALGSMSAWLAHRMRNPLNVILMCSQYLKTKFPEKDERQEVALAIEEKVKILEKMTRDFIEFSRSYQPRFEKEKIHEVLDQVLETVASRAKMQGVTIKKKYTDPELKVSLDRDLMEEVFGYLFDNAIEAMIGPGVLSVLTDKEDDHIVLHISNTGSPIPSDLRERLFDPFFTTKERGTGLGLAISRRVIESHDGSIQLAQDKNTTFRIELPINHEEED